MFEKSTFFPQQASAHAGNVDALFYFLVLLTVFIAVLIAGLIVFFSVKYRRRYENEFPPRLKASGILEAVWIGVPLLVSLFIFYWGAKLYLDYASIPPGTLDVYVLGKQWMWKFQHATGQAEINRLHVPVNRPVRLTMTSQDVIHSFFVPAFRIKSDLVPGHYKSAWFQATKAGSYRLFCAEYCGAKHAGMIGEVIAMEPADFQAWLSGSAAEESLASQGAKLFQERGCGTCHRMDTQGQGPMLQGLFGKRVKLQTGETVMADASYLRESILNPRAKVTAGFQPLMPPYEGQLGEEDVLKLVEYIKSLSTGQNDAN